VLKEQPSSLVLESTTISISTREHSSPVNHVRTGREDRSHIPEMGSKNRTYLSGDEPFGFGAELRQQAQQAQRPTQPSYNLGANFSTGRQPRPHNHDMSEDFKKEARKLEAREAKKRKKADKARMKAKGRQSVRKEGFCVVM
jgi:hypothetical protein